MQCVWHACRKCFGIQSKQKAVLFRCGTAPKAPAITREQVWCETCEIVKARRKLRHPSIHKSTKLWNG